jgi:hypothetical protein
MVVEVLNDGPVSRHNDTHAGGAYIEVALLVML